MGLLNYYYSHIPPKKVIIEENDSAVYLFYNVDTKFCKIGISVNVKRRLRELINASGCKIICISYVILDNELDLKADIYEKIIHKYYNYCRKYGEWFELSNFSINSVITLFTHIHGIKIFINENFEI